MRCAWVCIAVILILAPRGTEAVAREGEGQGPFGLSAAFLDEPRVGMPVRLWVTMRGRYDTTATGVARLQLPRGVELVSGDTLFRGHPGGSDNAWTLVIRAKESGRLEIQASVAIRADTVTDEGDMLLAFEAATDTAIVEWPRLTRSETVRGGQRYRYGGRFLVPIDGPEKFTQRDIDRAGQRAKGPARVEIACETCSAQEPHLVPMVAIVGADGRLVDARVRSRGVQLSDDLVAAATRAVANAQFQPGRFAGIAVADWVLLDVHVVTGKR
jgi:hypothetical protein